MKSETLRRTWALFAGALIFAAAGSAQAQDAGDECQVDTDCPGDPACGGPVCDWYGDTTHHKCVPAGTAKKGMDGWCNGANTECKCAAQGAMCKGVACSFTLAKDAPVGGGTGGAGGSATTGTGGTDSTGSGGTSTAPAPAPADSGGCALATKPAAGLTSAGLLVGLGAMAFVARRRRRAG